MQDRPASVTEAELAAMVARAGLTLTAAQVTMLHGVYGHFEAMLARLRGPLGTTRPRGAESAHVFVPGQEWR